MYLFVHHIAALLALFVNALFDPASKNEMRDELVSSSDAFSQSLSGENQLVVHGAAKGFCIVAEMLKVRTRAA